MRFHPDRKKAFLFDVDGTLVETGGAGRQAFSRAFEDVFGEADAFCGETFIGRTDPGVLHATVVRLRGDRPTDAEEARFYEHYLGHLEHELATTDRYRVLPGVPTILEGLAARPDCVLGLVTGNVRRGAYMKLALGGLDRFFPFGGFGSDDGDRPSLTRIAAERAADAAGGPVDAVVLGDSPLDAAAARANGLPIVLVATGGTPPENLRALDPDLYFDSLADWPVAMARLLGVGDTIAAGPEDVDRAAAIVRGGGVVVHPTATLYGLAADAFDPAAAERIGRIKGGRAGPFLALAATPDEAFALAAAVPDAARRLAARFWPGPLTLALPAADSLPEHLIGPGGSVAVRVDPHPIARDLCRAAGRPLLSTSANRHGAPPPASAAEIAPGVAAGCDLFLSDDRPLAGAPSTLVRVDADGAIAVLREGALPTATVFAALQETP